jgi:hypothetical protein
MESSQPEMKGSSAADGVDAAQVEVQPAPSSQAERLREARARRRRTIRQVLVVGFCFGSLLCLGGVAAGFLFYHQATKPDLSTPEHVARKYLEAYLIDRDEYAARQYQCANASGLAEIQALRADVDDRGKKFGLTFTFSVDRVSEIARTGSDAKLAVDLVLSATVQGEPKREVEHWQLTAHDDGGWRVCGAHEVD